METIKNYLEAMFANLPNTYEVRKAKSELLQMMEDKYNEMIAEGINENTAVGTVISEFGNLDELAEDLGLTAEVEEAHEKDMESPKKFISLEEAKDYIKNISKKALLKSLGILLLIVSHSVIIPFASVDKAYIGVAMMFVLIAIGVGILVYSSFIGSEWKSINKGQFRIDMNTATYISNQKNSFSSVRALCITIGVVLLIICWVPYLFAMTMGFNHITMFLLIGIGVFLMVYSSSVNNGYQRILRTHPGTQNSNYNYNKDYNTSNNTSNKDIDTSANNDTYNTREQNQGQGRTYYTVAQAVDSIFWPVTTCIYLIISFLTFQWSITWIIWVIAYAGYKIYMIPYHKEDE